MVIIPFIFKKRPSIKKLMKALLNIPIIKIQRARR
jgi:hypothetical protein